VVHVRRGGSEEDTKTKAGRRAITVPAEVVTALRQHRDGRPLSLDRNAPVFTTGVGTPIEPRNLNRSFDRIVQKAGVRPISFHGLRHTHATLLLLKGTDIKTVSARLGHASIQITLDTYGQVLQAMEERAAGAIAQALRLSAPIAL
jgi:integrase